MAKDKGPFGGLTTTAAQTAEQMTKQTQGAMENYFGWLQTTTSALPWSNTNLTFEPRDAKCCSYFCIRAKTQPSQEFPRRGQNSNRVYGEANEFVQRTGKDP